MGIKKLVIILFLFVFSSQINAQTWEEISTNPSIGGLNDFCYSPNHGLFICAIHGIWVYHNNIADTILYYSFPKPVRTIAISNDTLFFKTNYLYQMKLGEIPYQYQIPGIIDTNIAFTVTKIIIKNNIHYYITPSGLIKTDGSNTQIFENTSNLNVKKFDVDSNGVIYYYKNDSLCKIANECFNISKWNLYSSGNWEK